MSVLFILFKYYPGRSGPPMVNKVLVTWPVVRDLGVIGHAYSTGHLSVSHPRVGGGGELDNEDFTKFTHNVILYSVTIFLCKVTAKRIISTYNM